MSVKTILSHKDKSRIINRILSGEKYSPISRDYKVGISTIAIIGHNLGIIKQNTTHQKVWSISAIDRFLLEHDSTIQRLSMAIRHVKTTAEWKCSLCGHTWHQSFDTVRRRVESTGGKGCSECGYDEYTVYHDFLQNQLSPKSAYFVGVFFAKGVTGSNNVIKITCREKKKLKKIKDLLACTYPLKYNETSYVLKFKSKKIATVLNLLKKNVTRGIPKAINKDNELFSHFLRGYIDFKGYVNYIDAKTPRLTISGNHVFLKNIQDKYKQITEASSIDGKKREGCLRKPKKELYITGLESSYHFMNWIYNSEVNPMRYISNSKYDTFLELKDKFYEKQERIDYIKTNQLVYHNFQKELRKLNGKALAKKHKVKPSDIHKIIKEPSKMRQYYSKKLIDNILDSCIRKKEIEREMKSIMVKVCERAGMTPSAFRACYYTKKGD